MNIEQIVNEVIRRIRALENRNNLLVVYHESTSMDLLEDVLGCMDKSYLKIGIIGFKNPAPLLDLLKTYDIEVLNLLSSDEYIHMPYLLERYDGMLVTSMTIGQMYNVSVLNIQSPLEKLTMNWLTEKGKVYAIDGLNLKEDRLKQGLVKQLTALKGCLNEMGIEWIGKQLSFPPSLSGLLTKDMLIGHEGQRVFVDPQAVITPMAKEYAKAQRISIERK